MQADGVSKAFEILLEEMDLVRDHLNEAGAAALKAGDYEAARRAVEEASRVAELRDKVSALHERWLALQAQGAQGPPRGQRSVDRGGQHSSRGLRTPEKEFRLPILEALVALGGKASVDVVLDLVERKMASRLSKYDLEPLPSQPKETRWRNTARWCRNDLVREGLLKASSPRGVWEISEAGRKVLAQARSTVAR